jgi:hypothetical protein
MELDARLLITLAGMLVSVVSSFIVVRQKVGDLETDLRDATKKLATLDTRLDKNDTSTDLVGQRLDVIAGMLSPSERERLHRGLERHQAELEHLRRDVDKLISIHNGKHGPIE